MLAVGSGVVVSSADRGSGVGAGLVVLACIAGVAHPARRASARIAARGGTRWRCFIVPPGTAHGASVATGADFGAAESDEVL